MEFWKKNLVITSEQNKYWVLPFIEIFSVWGVPYVFFDVNQESITTKVLYQSYQLLWVHISFIVLLRSIGRRPMLTMCDYGLPTYVCALHICSHILGSYKVSFQQHTWKGGTVTLSLYEYAYWCGKVSY